jgi:hypothetical protein
VQSDTNGGSRNDRNGIKPIAPLEQSDFKFLMPDDFDTYIDLDIKLYIRGKLFSWVGKDLDARDLAAVNNNLLYSIQTM